MKHELHALHIRPWCVTALAAAALYASSPLHRLAGGDSGELMAEACVGGVAHPPGYPLLLALLQLALWTTRKLEALFLAFSQPSDVQDIQRDGLPFVYVANTLNVVFAVGAAACITQVVDIWAKRAYPLEAIAAGLMFATSALVWEYAIGLEVFALNNLLTGALHVLVLRHFVHPSAWNAYAGALVCGLGLANQHTLLLFEVPFVASVLASGRLSVKETLCCALSFVAGASVYVHTLVSAQHTTPGSWGDASTLAGLWTHVTRREYGTFRLSPLNGTDSERLLERLWLYALDTVNEFNYVGSAFACIGALHQVMQILLPAAHTTTMRSYSCALLVAMATYLLVFHSLANIPLREPLARAVSSRFAMQPNTVVAIWLGFGLVQSAKRLGAWSWQSPRLALCVRVGTMSAMLGYQVYVSQSIGASNEYDSDVVRSYGETLLHALPPNSLLLSYTDINWNSVRYLQVCEHQRLDVTHLSLQLVPFRWFPRQHALYSPVKFPAISRADVSTERTSTGYATYLDALLLANLPQFPQRLFLDLHAVSDSDIGDSGRFRDVLLTPHGALWQVHAASAAPGLFERWDIASAAATALLPRTTALLIAQAEERPTVFTAGSWAFAALTITNDGAYQAALFRLSHWLGVSKHIADVETLGAFVYAMRDVVAALETSARASQALTNVQDSISSSSGGRSVVKLGTAATGALSYPAYDVSKNAAVARMRFQSALEVLATLQPTAQWHRVASSSTAMQALEADVLPHVRNLRELANSVVQALLPAMRARADPHIAVVTEFLNAQVSRSGSSDSDSDSKRAVADKRERRRAAVRASLSHDAPVNKKTKTKTKKTKKTKTKRRVQKPQV